MINVSFTTRRKGDENGKTSYCFIFDGLDGSTGGGSVPLILRPRRGMTLPPVTPEWIVTAGGPPHPLS